jgi:DNA-binding transcriptional regulator LsrR (DeoR family)
MSNPEIARHIKREKNVKNVLEMFNQITISLNSIGSFLPVIDSLLYQPNGYLTESEINGLKNTGLIGDMNLRFFDNRGVECATDLKERTIGIEMNVFKNIKRKVTIASGDTKTNALRGALRGGLIDVLIIDQHLGKSLLTGPGGSIR